MRRRTAPSVRVSYAGLAGAPPPCWALRSSWAATSSATTCTRRPWNRTIRSPIPAANPNPSGCWTERRSWLAQGSTLSYGKTFSPHDRTVKLDGEAFFDVASDRDHPFFVKTNTVVVKVVGTSFNVKMYKDTDDTEVVLERGVVKLQFGDNDNMITMQPGQKIYYSSASHDISISEVNVEYLMLLKYGMISMSDVRVAEIIRKVEEIYSVDIETVAPLDDDRLYNFNFLKSNTLDDVLDIIEKMSGVKCRPAPAAGAE